MLYSHSQSNTKPLTPALTVSKSGILTWLKSLIPQIPNNQKIQDLGTGVIFCKLINAYFPHTIATNRIISNPKNQYENMSNLKQFQNALVQLKICVPFDVIKISKMKFLENWALINALHKHLTNQNNLDSNNLGEDSHNSHNPKRSFQTAFMVDPQYFQKQLKQNQSKQPLFHDNNILNYPQFPLFSQAHYFQSLPHQEILTKPSTTTKLFKQQSYFPSLNTSSPMKGKWSVNSQMFQNNNHALIDRLKQILLKCSHDTQKVRQMKMLLNIPLDQNIIKIEEDEDPIFGVQKIEFQQKLSKQQKPEKSQKEKEKTERSSSKHINCKGSCKK